MVGAVERGYIWEALWKKKWIFGDIINKETVGTILGIFINKRENKFPDIFIDKIQNLIIEHNFF